MCKETFAQLGLFLKDSHSNRLRQRQSRRVSKTSQKRASKHIDLLEEVQVPTALPRILIHLDAVDVLPLKASSQAFPRPVSPGSGCAKAGEPTALMGRSEDDSRLLHGPTCAQEDIKP